MHIKFFKSVAVISIWESKSNCLQLKRYFVLHIPLAETIKELDNFVLKGVDLHDHTKAFLQNTYVVYTLMICSYRNLFSVYPLVPNIWFLLTNISYKVKRYSKMEKKIYTVNPRFSLRRPIANLEIWHGSLLEGGGLLKRFVLYMGAYLKRRYFACCNYLMVGNLH